jgi:hypothetical protein
VAAYQDTVAFPLTPPKVALMVDVPVATAVPNPVVETVATVVLLEAQVAEEVTSCVEESVNVATALNCCVWLAASGFQVVGVTATLVTVLLLTVRVVLALTLPELHVIVVLPSATPDASPPLLMVAMFVEDDAQVTELVALPVVLLPYVAVAVYCCVLPGCTDVVNGEICSAVMVVEDGKNCPQPAIISSTGTAMAISESERSRFTNSILPLGVASGEGCQPGSCDYFYEPRIACHDSAALATKSSRRFAPKFNCPFVS